MDQTILLSLQGTSGGFDVFFLPQPFFGPFLQGDGVLLDLGSGFDVSQAPAAELEGLSGNGHLWAVPFQVDALGTFYNKKLLSDAGFLDCTGDLV